MFVRAPVKSIAAQASRSMSASAKVWINKDTKVICQGFTGKQVRRLPVSSGIPTVQMRS